MTLPTRAECGPWTDVRDAPWLWRSWCMPGQPFGPALVAPRPTLHLAHGALHRRRLLKRWLARHGEKHVWQFLRYRTALERVVP